MKLFLRSLSCLLLIVMLSTFCLWRNQILPDLSQLTAFMQSTADRLGELASLVQGGGNGGNAPVDEGGDFPEYALAEELDTALENHIVSQMLAHSARIDLSGYNLSQEKTQAVFSAIRYSHPELFFWGNAENYGESLDGVTTSFIPDYLYDAATTATMMASYEAKLDAICAGAPTTSEFDKWLYVHDYFVKNYTYDYTYTVRDAYTLFTENTGVCQAYMLGVIAVAEELGLETVPVTSNAMKHAWNLIKLDGAWYHMDVTWDDSVSYATYTSYQHFLCSDARFYHMSVPHHDWNATEQATDTKYDSAIWHAALTPMVKSGGIYYVAVTVDNSGNSRVMGKVYSGGDPAAMTACFDVNAVWPADTVGSYYTDCFAGLAVYGDYIIYNTNNTLRAYHTGTGEHRQIAMFSMRSGESIYGIVSISGNTLTYLVADDPYGDETPSYVPYSIAL